MSFGWNGGRIELGNWTWEKPEAVALKSQSPTGPPLIRLDKAHIKTTRCDASTGYGPSNIFFLSLMIGCLTSHALGAVF